MSAPTPPSAASAAAPLRVALIGSRGKMGRFTKHLLAGQDDFALVGEIGRGADLRAALDAARPVVGLDFTVAGRGAEHGLAMLECGVRPLIGTSGLTAEDDARLDAAARERSLGGLVCCRTLIPAWLVNSSCCSRSVLSASCTRRGSSSPRVKSLRKSRATFLFHYLSNVK